MDLSMNIGKTIRRFLSLVTGGVLVVSSCLTMAEVAGSPEAGLKTLAEEIVTKVTAADRKMIAILPFPNADGTCSVLSAYLADELILSLFSIPGSTLEIVERSQLEAILGELQIGEGGLLNPKTTENVGNISGVKTSGRHERRVSGRDSLAGADGFHPSNQAHV